MRLLECALVEGRRELGSDGVLIVECEYEGK